MPKYIHKKTSGQKVSKNQNFYHREMNQRLNPIAIIQLNTIIKSDGYIVDGHSSHTHRFNPEYCSHKLQWDTPSPPAPFPGFKVGYLTGK